MEYGIILLIVVGILIRDAYRKHKAEKYAERQMQLRRELDKRAGREP